MADDGSTLRRLRDGPLELWRPGFDPFRPTEVKPLPGLTEAAGAALLSSDARVVVARLSAGLVIYDVPGAQVTPISSSGEASPLDMSEDGAVVLLRDGMRYRAFRRDGTGFRDLPLSGPVNEIVLSGDGKTAFAVVEGSRIVRIELATGQSIDVVPATPYGLAGSNDVALGFAARGGLLRIGTINMPGGPATALRLGSQTWPVFVANSSATLAQVDWDAHVDVGPNYPYLSLNPVNESTPFEPAWIIPAPLKIEEIRPRWFEQAPPNTRPTVLAVHQDFGSVVTANSPARSSEVIHVYGTGFGDVSPRPPVGQPAPSNPLSRIAGDLQCSLRRFDNTEIPLEVLFAGLAPGLIGVYQIDIRMPAALTIGVEMLLSCRIRERSAGEWLPVAP